jgi:hypothetical protein
MEISLFTVDVSALVSRAVTLNDVNEHRDEMSYVCPCNLIKHCSMKTWSEGIAAL